MTLKRLNKFIAEAGLASRRQADELIREGRVTVNNRLISDLSVKIDPDSDSVFLDGEKVRLKKKVYFLLNKPSATITTTKDEKHRATVVNLINTNLKIFPVGRLDYNTTGALLLTNDGDFANYLTHPSNKVEREYTAVLDKDLKKEDLFRLIHGIKLDGRKSKFLKIKFVKKNIFHTVSVVTLEGRNHFVKNMFSSLGYNVKKLTRTRFGHFTVRNIPQGKYIELTKDDVSKYLK